MLFYLEKRTKKNGTRKTSLPLLLLPPPVWSCIETLQLFFWASDEEALLPSMLLRLGHTTGRRQRKKEEKEKNLFERKTRKEDIELTVLGVSLLTLSQ